MVHLAVAGPMAAGGDAIARLDDGRVIFVTGALPGEAVTAAITQVRTDFARARTLEVRAPSPARVPVPCAHRARGCGGCPWQHIEPRTQLELKAGIVADALRRIGRVVHEPTWLPPIRLPAAAYRTTMHVAITTDGRPSFHEQHSSELVEVDSCLVAHPRLAELLSTLRAPGVAALTLRIGVAGGERLAVLDGPRHGLVVPPDVVVVGVDDEASVHEEVGGRRWRIAARSFFQSGPMAAEALAHAADEAVDDRLPAGGLLVDAYAGVGVLGGLLAADRGARLLAIEQHPAAVRDARHNLADLDATVVAGEVGSWRAVPADVVVADPARPGLGRPGVAALTAARPRRVVLVSCDPASLGRDTALLATTGYRLVTVRVLDLFPHTAHVETVACFDPVTP